MHEDRTFHAGAGGGSSGSSAISRKISWIICRGIATSAIWNTDWPPLSGCRVVGLITVVIEALLVFQISAWTYAVSDIAQARVADATVVQEEKQEQWNGNDVCGWIGVGVSPMTTAFAESLGTSEPYGAIFDQPEPGSPAAAAHIQQGDVLTTINASPLMRASDFAGLISAMAATVYLYTWRDGQLRQSAW